MSDDSDNHRETGARKLPARPGVADLDKTGLKSAANRSGGLSQKNDETNDRTRQSDGVDQPRRPRPA